MRAQQKYERECEKDRREVHVLEWYLVPVANQPSDIECDHDNQDAKCVLEPTGQDGTEPGAGDWIVIQAADGLSSRS